MNLIFRITILAVISIALGCNAEKKMDLPIPLQSPSKTQWFDLHQVDQLITSPHYFNPSIMDLTTLDSLKIRLVTLHSVLNDEPGYRFERTLNYHYSVGLNKLVEEIFYNRKSIHKRKFIYNSKQKPYVAPVVTNETRKISSIVRQFFGLGADAVEMVGLADYYFDLISDSTVVVRDLSHYSIIEALYSLNNIPPDTLNFGVNFYHGKPFHWLQRFVRTPFFGWIATHNYTLDTLTQQPLKLNYLTAGNNVSRTYLYRQDGLFNGLIDSLYYMNHFVRLQVMEITYDSISYPHEIKIYFEDKEGVKISHKNHLLEWK